MRLTKSQKAKLLEWVGAGLETGEINKRAALEPVPFEVRKSLVQYYRATRKTNLAAIQKADEDSALNRGISQREARMAALQDIFDELMGYKREGSGWVTDVKAIGDEKVYVEKFNQALFSELRATLADAAAEMGDRKTNVKLGGDKDNPITLPVIYIPDNGRPMPGKEESHGN